MTAADTWGDVDRIVADALVVPTGARQAFVDERCAGRPDLAREVGRLLGAEGVPGPLDLLDDHDDADGGVSLALAARHLGPYRLIREIGRGGMGAVWLAERDDEQFRKQVAVKLLSAGLPVFEALKRFRDERQILASLEHPHIARLLDAGRTPDGLHYIVMEYVDGTTITEYCAAHAIGVRERVRLLRTIASTVHFAHQRLVVHRDLKPANILVTADGVPKLLDFGVAKMLAPGGAESGATTATAGGMLFLFTPAYASPEQLKSAPATTSSDVYSLGVLGYELLTGANPHRAVASDTSDLFAAVVERDPPKPSVIVRGRPGDGGDGGGDTAARRRAAELAGDLDAIVMKALRKDPQERYASAEELADDLGRFLDRRPVAAHRGTIRDRIQKFAARHRAGVVAGLLAVAIAIAGVAAVLWQAQIARRQRAVAERRFNDVRQLASAMIFSVYDQVARLPGSTPARQTLVTEALRYLDRLSADAGTDGDLALDLANAYVRVAEVQGNPSLSNLGDTTGALASYASARTILERELARAPGDVRGHRLLARVHLLTGDLLLYLLRESEARSEVEAGLRMSEELAANGQDTDRRNLAGAYFRLADVLGDSDEQQSVAMRRKALAVYERLLAAQPNSDEARRNAALTYKTLGASLADMEQLDASEDAYRKALALDEQRVAANPSSSTAQLDLSFDLSSIASSFTQRGNYREALAYWQRTIEVRRRLVDADPKDARARGRLAFALMRAGFSQRTLGDAATALECDEQAATLSEALVSANPDDSISLGYLAQSRAQAAFAAQDLAATGKTAAERERYRTQACRELAASAAAYARNAAHASQADRDLLARVEQDLRRCGAR